MGSRRSFWVGMAAGGLLVLGPVVLLTTHQPEDAGPVAINARVRSSSLVEASPSPPEGFLHTPFAARIGLAPAALPVGTDAPRPPLPEEWEEPFFAVLELDGTRMAERNARLMAMAMEEAQAVPRVQQECLSHLAYGLPDDATQHMLQLARDARIPAELRAEFVETLLGFRPQELCLWLADQLQGATEPALAEVARNYLASFETTPSE